MGSVLDSLDAFFLSIESSFTSFWNSLVIEEQKHHIILALALIIVLSVLLTILCNCCCWCCGLCRPRSKNPGLIYVPANYGTMYPPVLMYPPVPGPHKPPVPHGEAQAPPQPSTSNAQETKAIVHV